MTQLLQPICFRRQVAREELLLLNMNETSRAQVFTKTSHVCEATKTKHKHKHLLYGWNDKRRWVPFSWLTFIELLRWVHTLRFVSVMTLAMLQLSHACKGKVMGYLMMIIGWKNYSWSNMCGITLISCGAESQRLHLKLPELVFGF